MFKSIFFALVLSAAFAQVGYAQTHIVDDPNVFVKTVVLPTDAQNVTIDSVKYEQIMTQIEVDPGNSDNQSSDETTGSGTWWPVTPKPGYVVHFQYYSPSYNESGDGSTAPSDQYINFKDTEFNPATQTVSFIVVDQTVQQPHDNGAEHHGLDGVWKKGPCPREQVFGDPDGSQGALLDPNCVEQETTVLKPTTTRVLTAFAKNK